MQNITCFNDELSSRTQRMHFPTTRNIQTQQTQQTPFLLSVHKKSGVIVMVRNDCRHCIFKQAKLAKKWTKSGI